MGLFSWVRRRPAETQQASEVIARGVPTWLENRPLWNLNDYTKMAEDGYRRNTVIASCIKEIANSVAEPELKVLSSRGATEEPETVSEQHPLWRLLWRPNREQSQFEFFELLLTQLHVGGNAYVHKVRSAAGRVVELWLLRPDRVKIAPAQDGSIAWYEYRISDDRKEKVDPADVVQFKFADPLDDYYGLSPIAYAARMGDLDNGAVDYLRKFFENGAQPYGLLKFKVRVPKNERERVKRVWQEEHQGLDGWHTTAVLDADADYVATGMSPEHLNLEAVFDESESRICAAFGVPPILVAMSVGLKRATYSNYAQAEKSFWHETLMPMYRRVANKLTTGIAEEFGPEYYVEFDLSQIEALQENAESKRTWAVQGWQSGLLTRNEARELTGLPPIAGGDVLQVSLSTFEEAVPADEPTEQRRGDEIETAMRDMERELEGLKVGRLDRRSGEGWQENG